MTEKELFLLPIPREITLTGGGYTLPQQALIAISEPLLLFEGLKAQSILKHYAKLDWPIAVGKTYDSIGLGLWLDTGLPHPQSYKLSISAQGIEIIGKDPAGMFYGICTLQQLLQQYGSSIPMLTIHDWPDFPSRGVMLDVSRDKVPTMDTLQNLIERLASWKINQIQLYMEHTFAYRNHPEVWAEASPFTGEEILILDAFCRERHVELVPNQNSLGHMERWLKHPRYLPLAESPNGFEPPWGGHSPPTTLNPLDPGSIQLIAGLYNELIPHFTSPQFNVGGDEPWELGKGKSKPEFEKRGGRVYLEYLLKLYDLVRNHGRQTQFWADIIVHYPDLVPELPNDIIALTWGYEGGEAALKEWERQCNMIAEAGISLYICPGTSSWNSLAGRTDNAIDNCRITAEIGRKYGAIGYLITDWGDNGHWQPLPISYTGFAYGAAVSWGYEANKDLDMIPVLNHFAFEDSAGVMGKLAYELGNIYKIIGPEHTNGQVLATTLQISPQNIQQAMDAYQKWGGIAPDARPETLQKALAEIDSIIHPINQATMQRNDHELIKQEFQQAANLLKHAARRLLMFQEVGDDTPATLQDELKSLVAQQQANWMERNRVGGLADSLKKFDLILKEYEEMA
ncbi:MAG: family 20 glycosylhydrolase [Anaerolineae bacterium]|nr:family 20 glycosylhydrolase [Anaerolineae bacterium]